MASEHIDSICARSPPDEDLRSQIDIRSMGFDVNDQGGSMLSTYPLTKRGHFDKSSSKVNRS